MCAFERLSRRKRFHNDDPVFAQFVYGLPILVELCPDCKKQLISYLKCRLCQDPIMNVKKRRYENLDLCNTCHSELTSSGFIPNQSEILAGAKAIRESWSPYEESTRIVGTINKLVEWELPRLRNVNY